MKCKRLSGVVATPAYLRSTLGISGQPRRHPDQSVAQSPTINALSFEARIAQDSRASQVEEAALVALVSLVLAHTLTLVMVTMSSLALVGFFLLCIMKPAYLATLVFVGANR